ncbi:MAG: Fe-S cluster assembly protein SufB [Candidatus Aenigmarchaeota archaeon]|nr:Fe-S cluster assembly protein SufB [Candidatus Aenigmarchaeota archaeon]
MTEQNRQLQDIRSNYDEQFGFNVDIATVRQTKKGLSPEIVKEISSLKGEPEWMTEFRLKALDIFMKKPMPKWGPDLSAIDFDSITYYLSASKDKASNWDDVPQEIKNTFDRLGIPEAEKKFLAGVEAQFDSEVIYSKVREDLEKLGVIFCSTDQALKEHPEIFRKFFATVVPSEDNKFSALNSAFWSGGSFVYVPKGVDVPIPLQAYFRINAKELGQFERTLIIADEGSKVHYIEGCSAPSYSAGSLHAAVVEVIALEGAHVRYTTLQNWSNNVYNLVTKRAFAHKNAIVEWLDANIGSKITMKFPSVYLLGENAKADMMSIAFAGKGQLQDTGAKAVHLAPNTTSSIVSKSISKDGGNTTYRGLIRVNKGCTNVKSNVRCDALLMDEKSVSNTVPYMEINEKKVSIGHEASVGKIGEEQLFYLMSRGLSEQEATGLIVRGFFDCFTKQLPLEYAVEFNRLIEMEMEGSIG